MEDTVVVKEAQQYFTFNLGEENFALELGHVSEVLDYKEVTKVPRMPDFLSGVINLRGKVLPVIDLRQMLNMEPITKTANTCIVITEINTVDGIIKVGAMVDAVQAVIELDPEQISPAPKLGIKLDTTFIKGMGNQEGNFLIILNIDKVFSDDELSVVGQAAEVEAEL